MEIIKDYAGYNKAMAKSLLDKIWWLDKIPLNITTIIDFGCADGAMFGFIEKLFPKRFHYVGIDNNPDMLQKAKAQVWARQAEFYTSFEELPYYPNAVLVMNSVMHELLSYTTYWELSKMFDKIAISGIECIAVRDMYWHENPPFSFSIPKSEQKRYMESNENIGHENRYTQTIEYMLKAPYKRNWEREVQEQYLWKWEHWFYMDNYDIIHNEDFMLTYHRRKWHTRYAISWADLEKIKTHKKLLVSLRPSVRRS